MKTIFSLCVVFLAITSVHAQIYRPRSTDRPGGGRHTQVHPSDGRRDSHRGHSGVHAGFGHERRYHDFHHGHSPYRHARHFDRHDHGSFRFGYFGAPYRYSYFPRASYFPSYGYYGGYGDGYPYNDYPYADSYGYYGTRSAATNGLLLGALAGGIIGHNSGDLRHSAWRGSAWGAGLGWLLGSVVDANRRPVYRAQPASVVVPPAAQVQAQAAPAQPQQVTIINNYYNSSTPMSGANGMFGR